MDSAYVRLAMLYYFRYKRQFPLVSCETWSCGDRADILAVDKKGFLWNIEVKISVSDLRNDGKKNIHRWARETNRDWEMTVGKTAGIPARFSFALPDDLRTIADPIIRERYPYAGIFFVRNLRQVWAFKSAEALHNRILTEEQSWNLVRAQSGTLVRAMAEALRVKGVHY